MCVRLSACVHMAKSECLRCCTHSAEGPCSRQTASARCMMGSVLVGDSDEVAGQNQLAVK